MSKPITERNDLPAAGTYEIEPDSTVIRFRTRAMFGLLPVRGTYRVASGQIRVDDPGTADVTVSISAASFDSGNAERDEHVRNEDFLGVEEHPEIVFRAGRVQPDRDVDGELTVRGVSRPVTLRGVSVERTDQGRGLLVRARSVVDRYAFGITRSKGMAGRRQVIELEVAAAAAR